MYVYMYICIYMCIYIFIPLPLHFNADDHNINDLKVCILKVNFKDTKHIKLKALQFIINF